MAELSSATPEERDKARTERFVEMAARTYELNDEQKKMARAEVDAMNELRLKKMGPDAAEYDRLRQELHTYWQDARKNSQDGENPRELWRTARNDPKFRNLQRRVSELDRKYPLDWDATTERIEAHLPPEQAAKGKVRREERLARRERFDEMRRARAERRQEMQPDQPRPATPGPGGTSGGPPPVMPPAPPRSEVQPPVTPLAAGKRAQHPWESYVDRFIAEHELTEAQANSARSILQKQLDQARRTEEANAERLAAARKLTDAAERAKKLQELSAPTERLFEELRSRLDSLLTAEQRARARAKAPPAPAPASSGNRTSPPPT